MFADTKAYSGIAVDDMQQAREFYGGTLGLRTSGEYGLMWLHLAGGRDTLVYQQPDATPASYTILNFEVDDIDEAVDALAARGVSFERYDSVEQDEKGIFREEGPYIAWFKDPAGNVLSVLQEKQPPPAGAPARGHAPPLEVRLVGDQGAAGLGFETDTSPSTLSPSSVSRQMSQTPLVGAPNLLGISVADFNPNPDADGTYAARVVEALESALRSQVPRVVQHRQSYASALLLVAQWSTRFSGPFLHQTMDREPRLIMLFALPSKTRLRCRRRSYCPRFESSPVTSLHRRRSRT